MRKALFIVVALLTSSFVRAGQEQALYPTDDWLWRIAPVLGNQTFDGEVAIGNQSKSFTGQLDDISEKMVINVSAQAEGWKGNKGILMEIGYADMWAAKTSDNVHSEFNGNMFTFDALGSYGFGPKKLTKSSLGFELMAGARFVYLDGDLAFDPGVQYKDSTMWVEPVVGSRLSYNFADRWRAEARGDLGGFDIGSASRRTWRFFGTLHWQADPMMALFGGYRMYDMETSTNVRDGKIGLDGRFSGLIVGITFLLGSGG